MLFDDIHRCIRNIQSEEIVHLADVLLCCCDQITQVRELLRKTCPGGGTELVQSINDGILRKFLADGHCLDRLGNVCQVFLCPCCFEKLICKSSEYILDL